MRSARLYYGSALVTCACFTAWCRKMALSNVLKSLTGFNLHLFRPHARLYVCALVNRSVQIRGYAKKAGMIFFYYYFLLRFQTTRQLANVLIQLHSPDLTLARRQ